MIWIESRFTALEHAILLFPKMTHSQQGAKLSRGDKNPNKAALMFLKLAEAGHEALWLGTGCGQAINTGVRQFTEARNRNGIFDLDIGLMFV